MAEDKFTATNPVSRWSAQCFCVAEYGPGEWQTLMDEWCVHWEFQLGECPSTKRQHIECSLALRKKVRKMPSAFNNTKGLWRPTVGAVSKKFEYGYAGKAAGRICGPWSDAKRWAPEVPDLDYVKLVKECGLRPWQEQVCKSMLDQADAITRDMRKINVIVDTVGGQGKLVLSTWLEHLGIAVEIPWSKDIRDIMGYACQFPSDGYFFDLPRDLNPSKGASTFWAGVECLKDGRAYDPRYKSRKTRSNPKAVWIFTNNEPKFFAMTTARWVIWRIDRDNTLVDITDRVHDKAEDARDEAHKDSERKAARKRKRDERDDAE